MGKYRDMYNNLFTMPEEEFDKLLGTSELPKFKGKTMSYDVGDTEIDPHDAFADPDFKKEFSKMSDEDKQKAIAMIMNLQYDAMDGDWSEDKLLDMLDADDTPDDPDESSDKPHDKELAGETTPEEDFMQRAAEGKIPATSGVLAGDLTPEEIEMIRMMRAGKQPPKSKELAGETTPEEKEMLKLAGNQTVSDERMKNITNRLAINLSKHRW